MLNLVIACVAMVASWTMAPRATDAVQRAVAAGPPSDVLASVPRSAELVLVIDRFGVFLDSPVGRALWQAVVEMPPVTSEARRVLESWGKLSGELGVTHREAIDRLIGTRVVLILRDIESKNDASRWAVLSVISEQTDRELVAKLLPARRGLVEGHPTRAIESGKYEVTTHLHDEPGGPGPGHRPVSLLLTESGRSELFDELIGVWSGRVRDTLATTDMAREAAQAPDAPFLLAIRIDPDAPAARRPELDWSSFLLVTGNVTPTGLELSVLLRDHVHEGGLAQIKPWSDAPLARLEPGAALAVMESRIARPAGEPQSAEPTHIDAMFAKLGLSEPLGNLLVGRQLLVVRGVPGQSQQGAGLPRVSVCIGAESNDLESLASLGDQCISENVVRMEGGAASAEPGELDIGGVACRAVRRTTAAVPPDRPLAQFFGSPVRLAWTYVPSGAGATPQAAAGATTPGWWLVNVGEAPEGAVAGATDIERCQAALGHAGGPGEAGEVRRWFSIGVLRPSGLADLLGALTDIADVRASMKRIDTIRWRLQVTPSQDIRGSVSVETSPCDAPGAARQRPADPPRGPSER